MVREHISLKEAWELLKAHWGNRDFLVKNVPLSESLGGLLAEDIASPVNVPHYPASAVDGYAVSSDSTSRATAATPVALNTGQYQWVNTGAFVPPQYDSVVMVEDTSLKNDNLYVYISVPPGANLRPIGEDIVKGQIVAHFGDEVDPNLMALFYAVGLRELPLLSKPRAIFIPTGDEIVPRKPEESPDGLPPGKVMESNSIMLEGMFEQWKIPFVVGPHVKDDPEKLKEVLADAVDKYDLVLIGAGSAKGKRDFTANVIEQEGQLIFHWVLMRPGRPALLGTVKDKPVVGMPGFPMSTMVVAWSVVYPLLQLLMKGNFDENKILDEAMVVREKFSLPLLISHSSPQGISEWLRVKVIRLRDKKYSWPISGGSSSMRATADSDGFALIPPKLYECPKGKEIEVRLTKEVLWEKRVLFQGSDDPAVAQLVSFVRKRGADLVIRSVGSLGGLAALARGEAHLSAAHLLDPKDMSYNDTYLASFKPISDKWKRFLLFYRQQGFIVKRGNPKKISSVQDLARGDVRIVNRQPGAGTRVLLDSLLREEGIESASVKGYEDQTMTHLDASCRVAWGMADVALGIKFAADALGLDFIPITEEPYELVIPEEELTHPGIEALIDSVSDSKFIEKVKRMGGYRWP
ncbi:molybdopterin biosynthesis protein [Acetomicrobium sp.]|uniref:molybdopterin biosynthesis protein n=1 Tax=Acetomicrobium sp. TaxID=1872099 RepID=UPI001BD1B764|nr:molybdopterin biosynthesis protein [Acetomicrobium sp.]